MSTVFDIFNRGQQQPVRYNQQPQYDANFLYQLKRFASTIPGNPEQFVRNMLSRYGVTQQQFEAYGKEASQIQQMFNLR